MLAWHNITALPTAQGYILDKRIGVGQPKRIENARILVANTPMDTDKVKIYGARVGGTAWLELCPGLRLLWVMMAPGHCTSNVCIMCAAVAMAVVAEHVALQ